MEALLAAAGLRSVSAIRNRALIALLAYGGLRVSAALSLRLADFSSAFDSVVVRTETGTREIEMVDDGPAEAERWAAERRMLGLEDDGPFLCTLRGGPLTTSYVRELLPRLAARGGLTVSVTAEGLRRTHAAELRRRGWSLRRIQAQLGHGTLATTRRFLLRADREVPSPLVPTMGYLGPSATSAATSDLDAHPLLRSLMRVGVELAAYVTCVRSRDGAITDMMIRAVERAPGSRLIPEGARSDAELGGVRLSETLLSNSEKADLLQVFATAAQTGAYVAHDCSWTIQEEIRHMVLHVAPWGEDGLILVGGPSAGWDPHTAWAGPWAVLWEGAETALLGLDEAMRVVRGNRAARIVLGESWPSIMRAGPPFDFLSGVDAEALRDRLGGPPFVVTMRRPESPDADVSVRVSELWPPLGPCRFVLALSPVSESSPAEMDLRKSLASYRAIYDNSTEHIARFDRAGNLVHVNPSFRHAVMGNGVRLVGAWWEEERLGRLEPLSRGVHTVIETGEPSSCEVEVAMHGRSRRVEWLLDAERGPDGSITHVVGFGRDVTERHEMERRVRREAALNAALVRVTNAAVITPPHGFSILCEEAARILSVRFVVIVAFDDAEGGSVKGIFPRHEWGAIPGSAWRELAMSIEAAGTVPSPAAAFPAGPGGAGDGTRERLGEMSFASIPVQVSGSRWGAIIAGCLRPNPIAEIDEATTESLADAATGVVRFARIKDRAARNAALSRVALAEVARPGGGGLRMMLAKEGAELVGAQHGMVLSEARVGEMRVMAQWAQWPAIEPVQVGDTVDARGGCAAALALQTGTTALIDDVRVVEDDHAQRLAKAGFRSALAIPLIYEGRNWGLICVASTAPRAFDQDARATLSEFALLVGRWGARAEASPAG